MSETNPRPTPDQPQTNPQLCEIPGIDLLFDSQATPDEKIAEIQSGDLASLCPDGIQQIIEALSISDDTERDVAVAIARQKILGRLILQGNLSFEQLPRERKLSFRPGDRFQILETSRDSSQIEVGDELCIIDNEGNRHNVKILMKNKAGNIHYDQDRFCEVLVSYSDVEKIMGANAISVSSVGGVWDIGGSVICSSIFESTNKDGTEYIEDFRRLSFYDWLKKTKSSFLLKQIDIKPADPAVLDADVEKNARLQRIEEATRILISRGEMLGINRIMVFLKGGYHIILNTSQDNKINNIDFSDRGIINRNIYSHESTDNLFSRLKEEQIAILLEDLVGQSSDYIDGEGDPSREQIDSLTSENDRLKKTILELLKIHESEKRNKRS